MRTFTLYTAIIMLAFIPLFPSGELHAAPPVGTIRGEASYYADSLEGKKTASGEPYDKKADTGAHRTLPFGTKVKVTYLKTGKSVEVVINDRGPHAKGRIIDVSRAAAAKLGMIDDGHGEVKLEIMEP